MTFRSWQEAYLADCMIGRQHVEVFQPSLLEIRLRCKASTVDG